MAHSKSSTGVVGGAIMHPSTSRIGMKSKKSGTGTQISTKMMTQESSVLKEDQLLLKMESLFSGTSHTFDLNTPEIQLDDFDFKAFTYHNGNELEVGNSSVADVASPASLLSSSEEDSTSACAPATDDAKYTLIDMSPGSRDLLQADQYEQRIDLEKLPSSADGAGSYSISMDHFEAHDDELLEAQLAMENLTGNGLGVQPLVQPAQSMDLLTVGAENTKAEDFEFPQLSLDDESLIPKEILDDISNLLPEDCLLLEDENYSVDKSANLDMYLGTCSMATDIVSESLEQAGLHAELESMDILDGGGLTVPAIAPDQFSNMEDTVAAVQFTNPLSVLHQSPPIKILHAKLATNGTSTSNLSTTTSMTPKSNVTVQFVPYIQPDLASTCTANIIQQTSTPPPFTIQPTLETPPFTTPSTSTVNLKAPSKKRKPIEDVTPSTSTGKRLKRTSKKPLRYREPETIVEFTELDCIDGVTQAFDRIGYDSTSTLVKQESEENDETMSITTPRRGRTNNQSLTEEQKYHRIRVLNNEASKRCRLKRKQTIKEMEVELTSLERRNEELKARHEKLQKLRDRVKTLVYDSLSKRFTPRQ